jgi:hypothetical protein
LPTLKINKTSPTAKTTARKISAMNAVGSLSRRRGGSIPNVEYATST